MARGEIVADVREGLRAMAAMMPEDVTMACGPKGKHNPDRAAVRHGSEKGSVTLGARRVPVERPRMCATDRSGELRQSPSGCGRPTTPSLRWLPRPSSRPSPRNWTRLTRARPRRCAKACARRANDPRERSTPKHCSPLHDDWSTSSGRCYATAANSSPPLPSKQLQPLDTIIDLVMRRVVGSIPQANSETQAAPPTGQHASVTIMRLQRGGSEIEPCQACTAHLRDAARLEA